MGWAYLILAGIFEIGWLIAIKFSEGFTRFLPSIAVGACMIASTLLLGKSVQYIPVGTAYAVWTGTGAIGAAIFGMAYFGESHNTTRIACLCLIVTGIVGLKITAE